MNCKDCIHYCVCKDLAEILEMEGCICNNFYHFKDKSCFIELPCKVGDIVWAKGVFTENIYLYNEIDFKEDNIGKTVFLTKEEAEAKLKELNKE